MPQQRYIRWVPSEGVMKRVGRLHSGLYRATRGLVGARLDGLDMLLLTTRGRRSGKERTTPLPYFRVDDDLVLIGSFGGNPRNPAWVGNLRAEPQVTVQVRGRVAPMRARVVEGEEREGLWRRITSEFPRYLEYQSRTERTIPLVVLEGAATLAPAA